MLAVLLASALAATHPITGIELKPGESVVIRPAADGTISMTTNRSGDVKPDAGEVRLDMRAQDGKTYLTVTNGGSTLLRYNARMVRGDGRLVPTSVCPALSGGRFGLKTWQFPIAELVLYGFRFTTDPSMTCQ